MTLGEAFGTAVREIWIGPVYLGGLRECELVNQETGEIGHFLTEEERVRKPARAEGVPIYRTVTYGQEP